MGLTAAEKKAGRAFRDAQEQALVTRNLERPPDITVLSVQRHYRHECAARHGQSVSFELREAYILSPELWIDYCGAVEPRSPDFPHRDCDGGVLGAEAGRFAYIYKEGRCSDCGVTARSREGRLVDAQVRAPLRR